MATKDTQHNQKLAKPKNAYENFVNQWHGLGSFIRSYWITIAVILGIVGVVTYGLRAYFGDWLWVGIAPSEIQTSDNKIQYYPGKTLWDVLELIIVPLALAITIYIFNRLQKEREFSIEQDREREKTLLYYLDTVKELLRDKNQPITENDALKAFLKTLTEVTMHYLLDGARNGILLRFLVESGIFKRDENYKDKGILSLGKINLTGIDLRRADLSNLDLSFMEAEKADFRGAKLKYTILTGANLIEADFSEAYLFGTDLNSTNLYGARLFGADLWGAKIKGTTKLKKIGYDKKTKWPVDFDPRGVEKEY